MKRLLVVLVLTGAAVGQAAKPKVQPDANIGRYQLLQVSLPNEWVAGGTVTNQLDRGNTVLLLDTQTGKVWKYFTGESLGKSGKLSPYFQRIEVDEIDGTIYKDRLATVRAASAPN